MAAALATFGPWGIFAAVVVLMFWAWVFYGPKLKPGPFEILVLAGVVLVLIALFLPAVQFARETSRINQCRSQFRHIAYELLLYQDTKGILPAPFIADANGKPLLSWRVPINWRLYGGGTHAFKLDLSKSWDDPSNLPFLSSQLELLCCPASTSAAPTTDYLAVVGPQTAWPEEGGRKLEDFRDGPEETILLIEATNKNIPWAKPEDLSLEEAVDLLSKPVERGDGHTVDNGFFYKTGTGRHVVFADGHVAFIQAPLPRELAEALLTVAGGEFVDDRELSKVTQPQLDYAACYAFGMFVILSLLPAAWVRRAEKVTENEEPIVGDA